MTPLLYIHHKYCHQVKKYALYTSVFSIKRVNNTNNNVRIRSQHILHTSINNNNNRRLVTLAEHTSDHDIPV